MSQALYRKYRSRALSEVVGQEHITETLARAIKAGHIGHAYLFTGPRGTGKTSVARILAHQINGLPYSDTPQLDIVEIDAASNRRIDDIRDLREKVHIAPVNAKYKVYIIDEVHMLTGESFNALLKTLEEPPAHVVFILATTEVHKLPATIISRTQRYAFRPGTKDKIIAHLTMIAQKEKIDIEEGALELIAEHGEGSFRDSLSLLDQLWHISAGKITTLDVAHMLGIAPKEQITNLITALETNNAGEIVKILGAMEEQGGNNAAIVNQLAKALLQAAGKRPEFFALIDKLLDVPRAYNPQLKLIATLTAHIVPAKSPVMATAAPKTSATLVSAPTPTTIATIAPAPKPTKPAAAESTSTITTSGEPLEALEPAEWSRVLELLKEKSPPVFAILKQAQPVVENKLLTLKFKFGLMAKKLEDPKQKALVAQIVQQATGRTPTITILVDKNATPPPVNPDPHVSSVAAIMGGGEVIHAETI
jgi:DNA polymerase-3 subunit gamma/tau